MSACLSPDYSIPCDDGPVLYRHVDGRVERKRETLPPGTAEWNYEKYGVYCKSHAEAAAKRWARRWGVACGVCLHREHKGRCGAEDDCHCGDLEGRGQR